MSYYKRNSRYGTYGGYSGGRWRSEAWWMDGGANDEGYHDKYCHVCSGTTEHERDDCIPCTDRAISQRNRR